MDKTLLIKFRKDANGYESIDPSCFDINEFTDQWIKKNLEQSKSSETTDELIKDIIQGAEDFKNHHDKPYDNNTLKNCLIELRNKIESSEGEGKENFHCLFMDNGDEICTNQCETCKK